MCVITIAGHPGSDWLRPDIRQLRRVHLADQPSRHPRPDAVPRRRPPGHGRLQSVRSEELQDGNDGHRPQGAAPDFPSRYKGYIEPSTIRIGRRGETCETWSGIQFRRHNKRREMCSF